MLTVCLGGERSPQPLLDLWAPKLKKLLNTYGTTECPESENGRKQRVVWRKSFGGSSC